MSKIFEALQKAEREQAPAPLESKAAEPAESAQDLPELESLVRFSSSPGDSAPSARDLNPWLVVHWEPHSLAVEHIKRIRTNIQHYTKTATPPRTLLVTSAIPGEGKSLLAANLSISLAQGVEDSALLVDADIRNPTLHKFFGQPQSPGLSEYLSGQAEVEQIVRHTAVPGLDFIPAGGKKKNPIELVSSDRMAQLLEHFIQANGERFIVVDSTPVLITNEPSILAKILDGVLFVVRHDVTPRNAVKEAIAILTKEKILGVVLNGVDVDSLGGYRYAYEGYYSRERGVSKTKKGKKAKRRQEG
jgi:capsular exopolysaccharide synthesis family protein